MTTDPGGVGVSAYLDYAPPREHTAPAELPTPADDDVPALPGTRAVLYLRVSSAGQVHTDYDPEGISIPAQRAACIRKADQLGLSIVGEYVEPGKSATEMTKRVSFQQMLSRVRDQRDIDFIIIYELSRLARNRIDDAVVMADLKKRGVTLISATENIDASPVGQLMHGLLAAFNEYRSAKDGADIAYKMGEKAKKGGTLGRAPIGYLNTIDRRDGREIRSVEVDPERGPLVKLAYELYAEGNLTIQEIVDELTNRGLTTRPTLSRPAGPISHTKVAALLKDRYYLGRVKYKGDEFPGRHTPLISEELFERVQLLLEERGFAGERRRKHHHHLKGSIVLRQLPQQVRRAADHHATRDRPTRGSVLVLLLPWSARPHMRRSVQQRRSGRGSDRRALQDNSIHRRIHRWTAHDHGRAPGRHRDRDASPTQAADRPAARARDEGREPA
ncbi:recombinase family protein [Gordonia terrae]|uniref:recombinase family protein n=1 Tax=Gordonia hongkongensis TaxID=1701090 RepID=UPI0022B3566B|nr:recombinase family protein [Gordonia terrae]